MLSVILPASNEADLIETCLDAVLASTGLSQAEVIVVANGCTDDTCAKAGSYHDRFQARGWRLQVLEVEEGSKIKALNLGDEVATGSTRAYLDADVLISPNLLNDLMGILNVDAARYASGTLLIERPKSLISRAYARAYAQVPFIQDGVPGAGIFAVNQAGRARWDVFPDIISDDTFVRLQFAPGERMRVDATYEWPVVEGAANLIKVRRRQNRGVDQIRALYPHLLVNDDTKPLGLSATLKLLLRDPLACLTYVGVAVLVRLTRTSGAAANDWSRGR